MDDEPPPPPRSLRAFLDAVPPALLAACLLAFVVEGAVSLYRNHLITGDHWRGMGWARLNLLGDASWFATSVLMAVGFGQLRARTSGRDRALLTVAAVALAILAVRPLVHAYFTYYDPPRGRWFSDYFLWRARIAFGLWLVAGGCLAAVLATRGRTGLVLAGVVLAGVVPAHPLRSLSELLFFDDFRAHAWANTAIELLLVGFHVAGLVAAAWWLGREAPAPTRSGALSAGLVRIESALVARVVIAVGAALLTMMAVGGRSLTMLKMLVTVVPLAVLVTQVAMVSGLLHAAAGPGAPRHRLTWAAALTVLASFAGWCQAVAAFVVARARWSRDDDTWNLDELERIARAWPYALPALAVLGFLLLLWAVDDVRRSTPYHDPPRPLAAGVWVVLGTASALAVPHLLRSRRMDAGDLILIALLVAACNVIATLAVARACGKAAAALRNVAP